MTHFLLENIEEVNRPMYFTPIIRRLNSYAFSKCIKIPWNTKHVPTTDLLLFIQACPKSEVRMMHHYHPMPKYGRKIRHIHRRAILDLFCSLHLCLFCGLYSAALRRWLEILQSNHGFRRYQPICLFLYKMYFHLFVDGQSSYNTSY